MLVAGGSTNVTTYFAMRLAADGTAATGLTATNFDLTYVRSGAAPAAKVDATAGTAGGAAAHTDNTVVEPDATNQPGLYRIDWPDAAFAAGVREVILTAKVATAFTEHLRVTIDGEVNVVEWNGTDVASPDAAGYPVVTIKDGTGAGEIATTSGAIDTVTSVTNDVGVNEWNSVALGTTNPLPNVAAGAAGGLPTDTDANGAVRIVDGTGARELNTNAGAVALVDLVTTTTNLTDLDVTTYSEPGQGAPGVDISLKDKIGYLYKAWRNRSTQTATTYTLYADDATTADQAATVSDNATTADKGEVGTGA